MSDPAVPAPISLESILALIRSRRSTRQFKPDLIAAGLLDQCLEAARWAPSGYNLQPTHFVVVTDPAVKEKLRPACMKQRQVVDAPAVVVFTGDRDVVPHHFERVLAQDRAADATNDAYEALLRKIVPLGFSRGPLGLLRLAKALAQAVAEWFVPFPSVPAAHMDFWLAKQVSLAAMNFMLAAQSAGLASLPMEGFGERAVRRVLGIPRTQSVILIVAVGYSADPHGKKTRLSLTGRVHRNAWGRT